MWGKQQTKLPQKQLPPKTNRLTKTTDNNSNVDTFLHYDDEEEELEVIVNDGGDQEEDSVGSTSRSRHNSNVHNVDDYDEEEEELTREKELQAIVDDQIDQEEYSVGRTSRSRDNLDDTTNESPGTNDNVLDEFLSTIVNRFAAVVEHKKQNLVDNQPKPAMGYNTVESVLKKKLAVNQTANSRTRRVPVSEKEIVRVVDLLLNYEQTLSPTSESFWDKYLLVEEDVTEDAKLCGKRAVSIYRNHIKRKTSIRGVSSAKFNQLSEKLCGATKPQKTGGDMVENANGTEEPLTPSDIQQHNFEQDRIKQPSETLNTQENVSKPIHEPESHNGHRSRVSRKRSRAVMDSNILEEMVDKQCSNIFDMALNGTDLEREMCLNTIRTIMDLHKVAKDLDKCFVAKA